jgi:transcriptional regulator with XRE-family HTH domain
MGDTQRVPYQKLGKKLRHLREKQRESVAEVSGAVEIDEVQLSNIEAGKDRPSEDILLLLINHFELGDDFADELWQLAGYQCDHDHHEFDSADHDDREELKQRASALFMVLDPRVVYSDGVEIVSNKQGVIMNFAQTAGANSPPLVTARVGMSYEQARAVMGILHDVLYNRDNKQSQRQLGSNTDTGHGDQEK